MEKQPYTLTGPIGSAATLGLIVLQVDETIEQDFRRLFSSPEVALYVSRIPSGANLTPDTIAQMAVDLPHAASLFPPAAQFDAIGYACTSGTTLIGAEKVEQLVSNSARTRSVTNPLTASIAAFAALDVRSVAIVSPYIATVATPIRNAFLTAGMTVPATVSFGEEVEANVARIDPQSIEAVFLSCTNLRTLDIIDDLEARLGMPVVSSNQALGWHMAQVSSAPMSTNGPGTLLRS